MKEAIDIIKKLNDLHEADAECAHGQADDLLIEALRVTGGEYGNDVADAYEQCRDNVGFWYA